MSSPARSSEPTSPRILYLITSDISARFLRGQLGFLIGHGFEVHAGTARSDPPAGFDDGVEVHDLPFEREPSPLADLRALRATHGLIRRLRPDIVNASTPKAGLLGMLAARSARVPRRVYVIRGLRFETATGLRRHVFRMLERLAAACATDVVVNSRSLLDLAEAEGVVRRGRGTVLGAGSGNGIDPARFGDLPTREHARAELGLDPDAHVVGFVGRLTRDKGIVDLVEAFAATDAGTTLLVVGDFEPGDPVPAHVRNRIASDPDIVHIPWTDDTRATYAAMDVLAFPSHREGLPNVPLEAQLCGVPVIGYAATGTVDAIAPVGPSCLVEVGDVDALVRACVAALDDEFDPSNREARRQWVRDRFDQTVLWRRLAEVYER